MAKEAKSEKKATPKKAKESTPKKGNGDTPKRPLSGWMLFCKEQRPVLKEEGVENGDMMKELGARWKDLSDADKQPYLDEAKELKEAWKLEYGE